MWKNEIALKPSLNKFRDKVLSCDFTMLW
jgi:hypothetical protein